MFNLRNLLTDARVLSFIGVAAIVTFLFLGASALKVALQWAALAAALVLVAWLAIWLYRRRQARRAADALGAMLDEQGRHASETADEQLRTDLAELHARMRNAIATIKGSKLGQTSGEAALYELPWYMTIGNPAAGKSSAIVNSGLTFPFDDGGDCVVKGIGGTRNCDWFFTTEGILLDTAGRYSVHEEDRAEWLGFLRLLRKHRPRAPINGIIVTVSIPELIGNGPGFALSLAKNLRQRVQELTETLAIFAPVYVLFSKADLIPGFHEFFADLDWNERDRVWGATLPYDPQGNNASIALFDQRFDELHEGLRALSVAQLSRGQGERVAPGLLTFPSEFKAIQPALRAFVATLFEDNPFQFRPIFRGFYISSALQQGEAQPLLNEHIARQFALEGRSLQPTRTGAQYGFFLKDLFSRVIFADRHLVRQYARPGQQRLRLAAVFGMLALLGLLLGGWGWSFLNNRELIANVAQDLDKAVRLQEGRIDLQSRLAALEILQDRLTQLERFNDDHPVSIGLGLYRGEALAAAVRREYFAGVDNLMLRPVKENIESFLGEVNAHAAELKPQTEAPATPTATPSPYKDAAPANAEDAYNALKTYLMLATRDHIEVGHLSDQITRFWRSWLEANRGSMTREQMIRVAERILSFHLEHANQADWPLIENNLALIDQTRDNLRRVVRGMPAAERVYGEIRARAATRFPSVSVASAVGPDHAAVVAGSHVVSGAFTVEAWQDYVRDAIKDAATNAQDSSDWVLKTAIRDDLTLEGSPEQIQKSLVALYKQEYASEWKRFVQGISVASFDDFPAAVAAMGRLGDPQRSPLGTLLELVFRHTAWDNPSIADASLARARTGFVEWFKSSILRMAPSRVQVDVNVSGKPPTLEPGPIGAEFAGFARLMLPRKDAEPMSALYLQQLSRIRTRLNQLSNQGDAGPGAIRLMRDTLEGGQSELADALRFVDEQMLTGMPDAQRAVLRPLLLRPLLQSYAAVIKPAEGELNKAWSAQVFEPFSTKLAIKYPFAAQASLEAAPAEIAQIFGPEGAIAKYVDETMGALVQRRGTSVTPRTWGELGVELRPAFAEGIARWIAPLEGGAAQGTEGSNGQPQTVFMLRPQATAGTTGYVIEIDGQRLDYRNGPAQWANFVWPNHGGSPGARIIATTFDGTAVEVVNFPGRFGLEKMINAAQRTRQPDGSFRLAWGAEALTVNVDLRLISAAQASAQPAGQASGGRGLGGVALPAEIAGTTAPASGERLAYATPVPVRAEAAR